jgi:hypothetical protein
MNKKRWLAIGLLLAALVGFVEIAATEMDGNSIDTIEIAATATTELELSVSSVDDVGDSADTADTGAAKSVVDCDVTPVSPPAAQPPPLCDGNA